MDDLQRFWDEFAQEYHENEQETQQALPWGLRALLLEEGLLPTGDLLDLAGGTGKYFPALKDLVTSYTLVDISEKMLALAAAYLPAGIQLIHKDQAEFLQEQTQPFDLILSVMNPALTTKDQLLALQRLSLQKVVIMRVVATTDQLFTPFEPEPLPDLWMQRYASWLTEAGIPFTKKTIVVTRGEVVTRRFFQEYFAHELPAAKLQERADQLFGTAHQRENLIQQHCEVIWW